MPLLTPSADALSSPRNRATSSELAMFMVLFFIFSIGYATSQEVMVSTPGFKPLNRSFLTLAHSSAYCLLAYVELTLLHGWSLRRRIVPVRHYIVVAALCFVSLYAGNWSLSYIDYSTRIVIKSSKALPTMVLSRVLLGKNKVSTARDYAAGILLAIGLAIFTVGAELFSGDSGSGMLSTRFQMGIALAGITIFSDALISTYEQKYIFGSYTCQPAELIFFMYFFSTVWSACTFFVSEEPAHAAVFLAARPSFMIWMAISEMFGYLSISCVVNAIQRYGATSTEVVKTVRKAITVALSYAVFRKPFGRVHLLGAFIVILGSAWSTHLVAQRQLREAPSSSAGAYAAVPTEKKIRALSSGGGVEMEAVV